MDFGEWMGMNKELARDRVDFKKKKSTRARFVNMNLLKGIE